MLAGIGVVLLALAIVWVLFVPAADWLARHDVGSAKPALLQTARDAARGRLLTLGAGLVAVGALWFTARSFVLSREGQVTDRYTKAIEQLGSDKLDVRIGGIYALERVARDSARDHPTVMEVLTAFIRDHSREQWPAPDPDGPERERSTRPDVQAAITVVGRRIAARDIRPVDLSDANLTHGILYRADLADASLIGASLVSAIMTFAKLAHALLVGANLSRGALHGADLTGAYLHGANLHDADLTSADLAGADLRDADLTGAFLQGADLADASLAGAKWPENMPVPHGYERDTGSGRLEWNGYC